MQYHVVLEKLCICAIEHKTEQIRSFNTKDEALQEAHEWAENLSNSFCGKHAFDVVEVDENYVISVERGGFNEACEL
jgi:HKD family nuclease